MVQGRGQSQQMTPRSSRAGSGTVLLGSLRSAGQRVVQALSKKGRVRGHAAPAAAPRAATSRRMPPATSLHVMPTFRLISHINNLRDEESHLTQLVREAAAAYEHFLGCVPSLQGTVSSEARVRAALRAMLQPSTIDHAEMTMCGGSPEDAELLCRAAAHLKSLEQAKGHLAAVQSQLHAALNNLHDRTAMSLAAAATRSSSGTASRAACPAAAQPPQFQAPGPLPAVMNPVAATRQRHHHHHQRNPSSSSSACSSGTSSTARTVIVRDGDEDEAIMCDSAGTATTATATASSSRAAGSSSCRYGQYKLCPPQHLAAELALTSPMLLSGRRRASRRADAAVRSLFPSSCSYSPVTEGAAAHPEVQQVGGASLGAAVGTFTSISLDGGAHRFGVPAEGCAAAAAAAARATSSQRHHRRHHTVVLWEENGCDDKAAELQQAAEPPRRQDQPDAGAGTGAAGASTLVLCDLIARDVYHPESRSRPLDLVGVLGRRQQQQGTGTATIRNAAAANTSCSSSNHPATISPLLPGGGILPANYHATPAAAAWFESMRQKRAAAEAQAASVASPAAASSGRVLVVDLLAADPFPAASERPQHHQQQDCRSSASPASPPPPPPAYEECWQHATLACTSAGQDCCCTGGVTAHTGGSGGGTWTGDCSATAAAIRCGSMPCTPAWASAAHYAAAGDEMVMAACGAAAHMQLDGCSADGYGYGYSWHGDHRYQQAASAGRCEEFEDLYDVPLSSPAAGRAAGATFQATAAWHAAGHAQQQQQQQQEGQELEQAQAQEAGADCSCWEAACGDDADMLEALLAEGAGHAYACVMVGDVPFTYCTKAVFTPPRKLAWQQRLC